MNKVSPAVFFLYGLAGVGKSYVGEVLAKHFGYDIYHADQDLLPEMRLAVKEQRVFTDEMRDKFFKLVAENINRRINSGVSLVVTQAAYKKRHRDYLLQQVPGMKFIHVAAPDETIISRLKERGDPVTPEYAQTIRLNFEPPQSSAATIFNVGTDLELVEQFKSICR